MSLKELPLYIPNGYREMTQEDKDEICNGCGAKDGFKVPSTVWFLSIRGACNIHDFMFHYGKTLGDFYFANVMFFWNMTAIVYNGSNKFSFLFRMGRILKYFIGVMTNFGVDAFWSEKEANNKKFITLRGEFL